MSTQAGGRRPDVLAGIERLVVDGSNVLGVLARDGGPGPHTALVGRLRAAVPREIRVELVFDGPAAGSPVGRVAEGMAVRFAGRRTGDALVLELAATAALAGQPPGSNVLVVTDDRALAAQVRRHGVRTVGAAWLVRRLERPDGSARGPVSGGVANPRAPRAAASTGTGPGATAPVPPGRVDPRDEQAAADAERWRPGRRATAKVGRAHKAPRTRRSLEARPWKRRGRSTG